MTIVVGIIAIIAAVAMPRFYILQCKSRTSEARTVLKSIYSTEMAYFVDYEMFSAGVANLAQIDLPTLGTNGYRGKYYDFVLVAGTSTFTCTADASLDFEDLQFKVSYVAPGNSENGIVHQSAGACGD